MGKILVQSLQRIPLADKQSQKYNSYYIALKAISVYQDIIYSTSPAQNLSQTSKQNVMALFSVFFLLQDMMGDIMCDDSVKSARKSFITSQIFLCTVYSFPTTNISFITSHK